MCYTFHTMPTQLELDVHAKKPAGWALPDWLTAAGAALIAFAVYLYTVAPTVTGEDSGELVAAAYTLGIPHPSGYPIWCLLGKVFIEILPWGTVAWRVNVMSAFFGALTVGLVTLLGVRLTGRSVPAGCGALTLAFSREFWEQSLIAEVYTLNAFFVVLCALLLVAWYDSRKPRYLYLLALVYGVSLTNHGTMMVVGPIVVFFMVVAQPPRMRDASRYLAMALLIACGLLVYLYLPIRSRANPAVDWGNPESWRAFWAHVNREQYAFLFHQEPRSLGKLIAQLSTFLSLWVREFTPWTLWLVLPGFVLLLTRRTWATLFLATVAVAVAFAFMIIPNYPLDRENIWVVNVFWIPCYVITAVFIGGGIAALGPRFKSHGLYTTLMLVVVALPLVSNLGVNNRRDYFLAEDFARNILVTLAPNAIYFAGSDHANFPLLYLQVVEGERPDVILANPYGYPRPEVYQGMPSALKSTISTPIPTADDAARVERWVVENTSRPVYFSTFRHFPTIPDKEVVPAGLLFRVVPSRQREPSMYFGEYRWRSLDPDDVRGDFSGLWILYDYHAAKGRAALANGAYRQAVDEYETALALLPDSKHAYNNAGTDLLGAGLFEQAIHYYLRALQLDPEFEVTLRNLALVYGYTNQSGPSLDLYQRLLVKHPDDPELIHGSAMALLHRGAVEEALVRLRRVAELAPDNPQYLEDLGTVLWDARQDSEAGEWLDRALRLNPANRRAANLLERIRNSEGESE